MGLGNGNFPIYSNGYRGLLCVVYSTSIYRAVGNKMIVKTSSNVLMGIGAVIVVIPYLLEVDSVVFVFTSLTGVLVALGGVLLSLLFSSEE